MFRLSFMNFVSLDFIINKLKYYVFMKLVLVPTVQCS